MKDACRASLGGAVAGARPAGRRCRRREPCEVPTYLWFGNNDLKHVAEAVKKDNG